MIKPEGQGDLCNPTSSLQSSNHRVNIQIGAFRLRQIIPAQPLAMTHELMNNENKNSQC